MNWADILILLSYLLVVFYIAIWANRFLKRHSIDNVIEQQYLAGKTVTYLECLFSLNAAAISAFTFMILPKIVFNHNFSFLQTLLGVFISRFFIANKILPHLHEKSLTIFETLARGVFKYEKIKKLNKMGRLLLSSMYFMMKLVDVSFKLYLGSLLVSRFLDLSIVLTMFLICSFTYAYTITGGLKAVVRTDIFQTIVFTIAALVIHSVVSHQSGVSWTRLVAIAWEGGKFSLIGESGPWGILIGIASGIIYDVAIYGCDQELLQKMFAVKDLNTAKKSLIHSSWPTLFLHILFLSIGAILWSFCQQTGIPLKTTGMGPLFQFVLNYTPSPIKGLIVAGLLATVMSSLDSALNALTAVFWNDIMPNKNATHLSMYVKIDMLIITQIVLIISCVFHLLPSLEKYNVFITILFSNAPIVSIVLFRIVYYERIKLDFNPLMVMVAYGTSVIGLIISTLHLIDGNEDWILIICVPLAMLGLSIYSILNGRLSFESEE